MDGGAWRPQRGGWRDGLEAFKKAGDQAGRFRVEGVPFFIVNGKVTLSGAQLPNAFLEAFKQALAQN